MTLRRPSGWLCGALAMLSAAACHSPHQGSPPGPGFAPPLQLTSGAASLTFTDGGFPLVFAHGDAALVELQADSFQVGLVRELDPSLSYDPYWMLHSDSTLPAVSPPGLSWDTPATVTAEDAGPGQLTVVLGLVDGTQARVQLSAAGGGRLDGLLLPDPAATVAFLRIRLHVSAAERFYGLGEWFDSVEQRGKLRPMQLEPDFSLESSDTENHVTVPLLLSSNAWGIFIDNRRPAVFDVASVDPTVVDIFFGTAADSAQGLSFHLFAAGTPLDLIKNYYDLTGPPRLPAPWALGPWIWRDDDTGQAQVDSDIQQIHALNLATSGIWIDRPYASDVESFDFAPADYPDAGALIAHARAEGLGVALWHAPYEEDAAEPFHGEAADSGYFPPRAGLLLNPWSAPIDFSNAGATAWWQGLVKRYTDLGVEGFKLDYGEDVTLGIAGGRTSWLFHDGSDEGTMASRYTELYHQAYDQLLPADGGFLLCRAAHWGDQVNGPIIWPGDVDATLTSFRDPLPLPDGGSLEGVGGVPSALNAALSLSASGFPFFAADTGGYRHSPASKETWIRWVEQSALGVAMETGDSSSQVPWDRDAESLADYQTYALLHARLFPYVWTYVAELATTGRPVLRPFGLANPGVDAPPEDEFLVGEELLAAPVNAEGATSRQVVFPPGDWVSWWDGSVHSGTSTIAAPLGQIPLFARSGAVVPLLRPTIATLATATDPAVDDFGRAPGILYLMVYAGTGSFTAYDGTSITQSRAQLQIAEGSVFTSGFSVQWMGVAQPTTVMDDGAALGGASWTASNGGTLTLQLGPGAHDVILSP